MPVEHKKLSPEAQTVQQILTADERRIIQKDYPIRGDRDDLIRSLKARKIGYSVLAELSGLREHQLLRITKRNRNKNISTVELLEILKPYERLITALYEFLKFGK